MSSRNLLKNNYVPLLRLDRHFLTDPKYSFLKKLGITSENPGLYDGRWGGSGKVSYWVFFVLFYVFERNICKGETLLFQTLDSIHPGNGKVIARVRESTPQEASNAITEARKAWPQWASLPIPARGEIIRQIGEELRNNVKPLGQLVSLEMGNFMNKLCHENFKLLSIISGKILAEGIGEVQEYIDICDYAVGLSRTLSGSIFPSERKDHTLLEKWNPLGVVGVISAFNFPVAVRADNFVSQWSVIDSFSVRYLVGTVL